MRDANKAEFLRALEAVYALYRAEYSAPVAAIWWRALQAYEIAAVVEALGRHAMNPDTGQFLPKPADVVKQLEGATQDVALLAWNKALEGLKRHGTYASVTFDDPIINRVLLDLGGWVWFGQQTDKEMPFIEKRFRDAYRAWRNRGMVGTEPVRHLPGIIEVHNAGGGFHDRIPAPKLIGDPIKAQAVLDGPKKMARISEAAT